MDGWREGGREEGGLCSTPTFIYNMAATLSVLATPPSAARLRLLLALFGLHLCQFLQTNWLLLTSFLLAGSEAPSPFFPPDPAPLERTFCIERVLRTDWWQRRLGECPPAPSSPHPPHSTPPSALAGSAGDRAPLKALSNEISARCCTWLFAQLTPFPLPLLKPANALPSSHAVQWRCQAQIEGMPLKTASVRGSKRD